MGKVHLQGKANKGKGREAGTRTGASFVPGLVLASEVFYLDESMAWRHGLSTTAKLGSWGGRVGAWSSAGVFS